MRQVFAMEVLVRSPKAPGEKLGVGRTERNANLIRVVNRRNEVIVTVCTFVTFFMLVTVTAALGYISLAAKHIAGWGFSAHIIIFFFIIFVSQPFGYGYWVSLTAFGYALGWSCLPSCYVGFVVGTVTAFIFTKYVANDFVTRKVEHILEKKHLSVNIVAEMIRQNGASKYSLYISIRHVSIHIYLDLYCTRFRC